MDIFFADPSEVPLPPGEVRIRRLEAAPYPDGRRLRVTLEVDPFQQRPNAEIILRSAGGDELAGVNIVESMNRKMEMTMHLRRPAEGLLTLDAVLFYMEMDESGEPGAQADPVRRLVVDTAQAQVSMGE